MTPLSAEWRIGNNDVMLPPPAPDFTHGSVLLSLWFFVVLAAVAVGFVVLSLGVCVPRIRARFRLRARRARIVGAGSIVLALVFGIATAADGINRHFAYMPSFSALRGHYSRDLVGHQRLLELVHESAAGQSLRHGVVERVLLNGARSSIARHGYVYLPRVYFDPKNQARRFPVLYLLHGSPGVAADWLRAGFVDRAMDDLIDHHKIEPFIVVLPDVNGGYGRDTECQDIVGGAQVQTYLTYDVTAWIDRHYRTIATPARRAIGGLSTGGYCALNLTLRHQDVFSAAVMHSGSLAPIESRYSGGLWGHDDAIRRANTPSAYIPTLPLSHTLAVYCDGGADDHESVRTCTEANRLLSARHVPVETHILLHEGHSFSAWRKNLYLSLPWVSHWFTATPG
jgi:enterochelin esterase-like enzyme